MKRMLCRSVLCLAALLPLSCVSQHAPPRGYLGLKAPGSVPEIFAPGTVSLPDRRETKIVFSPGGNECFIQVENRLLYSKFENGRWPAPAAPSFLGNGRGGEPFFSPDGKMFFFVRRADIWVSHSRSGQWSNPVQLGEPVNTTAEEWHPTATLDGTLYFCSSRGKPEGGYNIYRSMPIDGGYTTVEKLGATINSPCGAWDPFIAPDESYMLFSSDRPDGFGSVDQYIAYRARSGGWSEPRNLGPVINTKAIEYGSYLSPDGNCFFFSRPAGWKLDDRADIHWVDSRVVFERWPFGPKEDS